MLALKSISPCFIVRRKAWILLAQGRRPVICHGLPHCFSVLLSIPAVCADANRKIGLIPIGSGHEK
jgi:hypothetical protein